MLSYNDMNKEQKHSLKKVLFVFIIGTILVVFVPIIFHYLF